MKIHSKHCLSYLGRVSCLPLLWVYFCFTPSAALASSSVNVPLDSWVYEALDRLEGYGLIDSALTGTKPYTKLEVARLIGEAMEKWQAAEAGGKISGFAARELIPFLFERFKTEFRAELVDSGFLEGSKSPTYLKPADEVVMKYIFQTDNPIVRPQATNPPTHTVYPIYNNDGIVYRKQNNFSADLRGEARLWNHISFYYQPIFKAFENEGAQVDLEKGYVKAEAFNIELEAGRDSLWYGPGYNGGLLMTNNARPFDLLKLSNPRPFSLPLLGLFKFNAFVTRLDYDAPSIPHPILSGLRLNFKPHPLVEFGVSENAIFGGEGREGQSVGEVFRILFGNENPEGNLASNKQLAIDLSFRWPNFDRILPIARSWKIYGEVGAEDSGFPPDKGAWLLGISFYDLLLTGRMDLRLEYARTAIKNQPFAWYTHPEYPAMYHERVFGHHMGSNAENVFARLSIHLSPEFLLGIDFNAEAQGISDASRTDSRQWGVDVDYYVRKQISVKGRYIINWFEDREGIAGGGGTQHFLGMEFRKRF